MDASQESDRRSTRDNPGNQQDKKQDKKLDKAAAKPDGSGAYAAATGRDLQPRDDQRRYRRYQYALIAPHCGASVLEVGAGLGDFSAQFTDRSRVVVTDVDPDAVASMASRFADRPQFTALQLDVTTLTPELAAERAQQQGLVDSVLAINVLEHIEDHVGTLRSLSRLVRPGGTVVQWVPGYMSLYGDFDRTVGHVRRYTPQTLAAAGREAGLEVRLCRPVNFLGGIAWWLAVRKGGAGSPKPSLVRIYDNVVVPATRVVDHLRLPFGQSVLGVFTVRPDLQLTYSSDLQLWPIALPTAAARCGAPGSCWWRRRDRAVSRR